MFWVVLTIEASAYKVALIGSRQDSALRSREEARAKRGKRNEAL